MTAVILAPATTANSSAQKVTLLDTATARKLMAKKKLNVEEIIELLKATYNGMPNFTPILSKGSIETLREVNQKTVRSPEIGTAYYGFCKKTEIVSELNRLFCELLLDIRENGDLHQNRRTEVTRENGVERRRRYYDDVVKAWLYQLSRTNHPVEYEDKIIEINLQPETPAYTPEIIPAVDQHAQPAPVEIKHSTPRNIHEVVIIAESYGTISAPETAPVKINPEVKPDYDATFDECAYTPDYQPNRAVLDDEPQPHRLIIKRRPAPAGRKLPTPKSRRQVYDFSKCADADTLRKALNTGDIDTIKAIAESYREFQPRTDGKTMTKKDYVTAIIRLYFPDYQPKAPTQEAIQDFHGIKFTPGKIYVLGSYYDIINNRSPRLFKVIRRNKSSIVIQEISNPDFMPAIGTECKTIKTCNRYPFSEYISFSRYSYDTLYAYWDYDTIYPYSPGYDIDFDETVYTPEYQDNLAVLDDIPADHEPDTQPLQTSTPEATEQPREPWQEHTCDHCNSKPNWTHEQFIKGILLYYEYEDFNHKSHQERWIGAAEYLRHNYSLVQLWKLAKFFGLSIPKIKLTGNYKSQWKKYQIAEIIAEETYHMEHVYVCTYKTAGAPDLPAELAEHAPKWEKEMIAHAQATPVPAPVQEVKPKPQPAPAEPERQQEQHHLVPLWSSKHDSYDIKKYKETRRQNKSLIDQCDSLEQIKNTLLTLNDTDMLKQAAYMRIHAQFIGLHGRMKTREEVAAEIAEIIIARRQRKAKTETRNSASKPATKKPRHAKKLDDSRQILIQFDSEDTPAPASTPAKPKARRTHKPRVKRDYSRQILIDFGENIPDGQTNQRKAA